MTELLSIAASVIIGALLSTYFGAVFVLLMDFLRMKGELLCLLVADMPLAIDENNISIVLTSDDMIRKMLRITASLKFCGHSAAGHHAEKQFEEFRVAVNLDKEGYPVASQDDWNLFVCRVMDGVKPNWYVIFSLKALRR